MAGHPQPRVPRPVASYRSSACRIGTHHDCSHSSPTAAPVGIPVVYEACECTCHPTDDGNTRREVTQ